MTAAERDAWIAQHKEALAAFCQKWQITELALADPDLPADPEQAIGVLVYFAPDAQHGLFSHIDMEVELSRLLGRRVDIVSRPGTERNRDAIIHKALSGQAQMVVSQDDAHLATLLAAARDVRRFVAGRDWAAFEADRLLQDAVLWGVTVMGKAAENLSHQFRASQPDVPWDDLIAQAGELLAGYDQVDLERIWQAVTECAPAVITALESLASSDA